MTETAQRMIDAASLQFAEKGFSGASMRAIAAAAGTTQATIYHHFSSKEALYTAVLASRFEQKTSRITEDLQRISDPETQLKTMVGAMLQLMHEDPQFRQLYARELLEGDERRLSLLAKNIFGGLVETLTGLLQKLAPTLNSNLMLLSVAGLVWHHLEARKISHYLPGASDQHQNLETVADHITQLLLCGIHGK